MSVGSFIAGVVVTLGVVGFGWAQMDDYTMEDAQKLAATPTETINATFAAAGKGLVAVTIQGKECFARLDNGLPKSSVMVPMTCVP